MRILSEINLSRSVIPAFMLLGVMWGGFAAYVPEIKHIIGASDAAFGSAMLIAALGAVSAMWLAPFLDKALSRFAVVALMILAGLAYFIPALAGNIAVFTLGMVLVSAFSGTVDVIMNARLSHIETEHSVSLMGLNHGLFSFAYAASSIVAGLFRGQDISMGGFAIAVMSVALILVYWAGPSNTDPQSAEADEGQTVVTVALGVVILPGLIILIAFLTEQATEAWSALHIERVLHVSAELSALGPAILGVTMGIGRLAGHYGMKSLSETKVVNYAACITATGAFLAAWSSGALGVYLGFGLLGAGVSVMVPMIFSYVAKATPSHLRTKVISRVSVIGYAGFFLGPPTMGFLSEIGTLTLSFSFVGVLLLSVPILLWVETRR